jgi:hypothetical protein
MNIFRPMQVYTVLTQDTSSIPINQLLISCFQKSTYFAGIKIFSNLPSDLKTVMNEKAWYKTTKMILKHTHFSLLVNTYNLKKLFIRLKVV